MGTNHRLMHGHVTVNSEEACPSRVPVDTGAGAWTPLMSALPGCGPKTWVKTLPGGHVTPDGPGMAALDGDMIMAHETMISDRPIRILPAFIDEYLVVPVWIGDTPVVCGFVYHLIVMWCAPADKYPKSPEFDPLTPGFNGRTPGKGKEGGNINCHALIFR